MVKSIILHFPITMHLYIYRSAANYDGKRHLASYCRVFSIYSSKIYIACLHLLIKKKLGALLNRLESLLPTGGTGRDTEGEEASNLPGQPIRSCNLLKIKERAYLPVR